MPDRITNALVFLFMGALFLIALPFFLAYSPVYLARRWRRRSDGDADIYRPLPSLPMPAPMARASAWFQTDEGQGLVMMTGLVAILAGSLVAVFAMGVDPVGVLIVAVPVALGVMGVVGTRLGGQ